MEPPAPPPPPAADELSSLPDDVVDCSILTRLNLRDVVRTSALSRTWRHRWESLPTLSLPLRDGIGTPESIVDSVLSRYAGRIPHFSIRINSQSASRVDDWLIDLSLRDVQYMDFRSNDYLLSIHSSIYSFSHLVILKLHRCDVPKRPVGFAGFPLLKELELVDTHLSEIEDLEAIVRGSPLLDALMLSDVYYAHYNELARCVIEAPNLRSLTIISVVVYGWQFGGLPRLDNVTVDLDTNMYEGDLGEFLAGVAHARKLTLTTFYPPKMGHDTLLETLPYNFFNLRSLFLCTHFCGLYSILATFCLLRNAPSLEELEIMIDGYQEQQIEANTEFQNTQWTNGMCASLQVVTINGICCLSNEMCFIELVLSKATALRTMSIILDDEFSRSYENILSELNTYGKASPHAQVLLQRVPPKRRRRTTKQISQSKIVPFHQAKAWNLGLGKRKNFEQLNLESQQDSNSTT